MRRSGRSTLASLLLLATSAALAGQSSASHALLVQGAEAWQIYGTPAEGRRDPTVPGSGSLEAPPLKTPANPWSSGAVLTIPQALAAGQRISVAFWARAATPETVRLTFQANAAPYPVFLNKKVALTPKWRRYAWTATAPRALTAGSQSVSLQLGQARAAVWLGPVALIDGAATPARINAAFAAFRPDHVDEAVSIPSEPGVVLAGTLRTPTRPGAGPFPAVLFLSGSGPGQRGAITPIEKRLLADGFAILNYDKRGVGQSTGQFVDTLRNMETDATAAVRFLRSRRDIDGKRIAIAGHSQGGAVAPAVAAKDPAIAAVVMLAGPVAPRVPPGPGHEINLVIMRDMLARAGADPAAIDQVSTATERLFEAELRGAPLAEIAPLREEVLRGFIACKFSHSGAEGALATLSDIILEAFKARFDRTLAKVHAPVLALFGSDDEIVPAADNLPVAKMALANNPDAKIVDIPDVNHYFRHVENISSLEKAYPGPLAAPEVISLVGDWLDVHLRPAGDRQLDPTGVVPNRRRL